MLGRDIKMGALEVGILFIVLIVPTITIIFGGWVGLHSARNKQQAPQGAVHVCTVMLVDEYTSVTRCIVRPLTVEDLEDVAASSGHTESNRQSIPDL